MRFNQIRLRCWASSRSSIKRQGQHPGKQLSALQLKQKLSPGRYTDGNGFYPVVDPSGAKRWILWVVVQGRRRDIGLGGVSLVGLAEALKEANHMLDMLKNKNLSDAKARIT
ncbi:Arm DNA-binding domain-containing protein [Mesorhizobium sp. LNHC252B00]|uniref:Arm DNA-binding domain-containing protein n=1 Tax=Mesorhizobium sp. LNHC252B00 TaxID=1287252 RepID=UPI0032AF3F73